MPKDLLRRIDWDQIHPELMQRCFEMCADAREAGFDYFATSGYRTPEEQIELYEQGRSKPGPKVTWVQFSLHNLGLAVDWTYDAKPQRRGLQPNWDKKNYDALEKAARKNGLITGGMIWGKDEGHVQIPLGHLNLSLRELKNVYEMSGRQAVWDLVSEKWSRIQD